MKSELTKLYTIKYNYFIYSYILLKNKKCFLFCFVKKERS